MLSELCCAFLRFARQESTLRVGVADKMGFYVFLKCIGDHNKFSKLVNYLKHELPFFFLDFLKANKR